jgi:hypothetical protein
MELFSFLFLMHFFCLKRMIRNQWSMFVGLLSSISSFDGAPVATILLGTYCQLLVGKNIDMAIFLTRAWPIVNQTLFPESVYVAPLRWVEVMVRVDEHAFV